jgi:hypothetical protein
MWSAPTPGRFDEVARGMQDRVVRIGAQALTASSHCMEMMRDRLRGVPLLERSDIAYRASSMIRQARADGQLHLPMRGDIEDAVAMLLVLGVTAVHT